MRSPTISNMQKIAKGLASIPVPGLAPHSGNTILHQESPDQQILTIKLREDPDNAGQPLHLKKPDGTVLEHIWDADVQEIYETLETTDDFDTSIRCAFWIQKEIGDIDISLYYQGRFVIVDKFKDSDDEEVVLGLYMMLGDGGGGGTKIAVTRHQGTDTYPSEGDGCVNFSAQLQNDPSFDVNTCTDGYAATDGDFIIVQNLAGSYIAEGTDIEVFTIGGHYYTYVCCKPPRIFRFSDCSIEDDAFPDFYSKNDGLENYCIVKLGHHEAGDTCWEITEADPEEISHLPDDTVFVSELCILESYETCDDCMPKCIRFKNCDNSNDQFDVVDTEGTQKKYIGKIVKISGNCYTVSAAPNCDKATEDIPIITAQYDDCLTCLSCWKIQNCDDSSDIIITRQDLSQYKGRTIKIGGNCYIVVGTTKCTTDTVPQLASIEAAYDDCSSCNQTYLLTDCADSGNKTCTTYDLSAYVGEVVRFGISSTCWQVSKANCVPTGTTGVPSEYYPDCSSCGGTCTTLQNCNDSSKTLKVKNKMTAYVGKAVEISGQDGCWIVQGAAGDCSGAIFADISAVHDSCLADACTKNCYPLASCLDLDTIYTQQNLEYYVDKVVKLDDGTCWTVAKKQACGATPVEVNIIGEASDCNSCAKCWQLQQCGTEIITYVNNDMFDYQSLVVKISGTCYEVLGADDGTHCDSATNVTIDDVFTDCDSCLGSAVYVLTPIDTSSCLTGCCQDSSGGDAPPILCSKDNLDFAVGKIIKYEGVCYAVSRDDGYDCADPVSVDGSTTYTNCQSCISDVQVTTVRVVSDVTWNGTALVITYKQLCIPVSYVCTNGSSTISTTACE